MRRRRTITTAVLWSDARAYRSRYRRTARWRTWEAWNEAGKVTTRLSKRLAETSPTTVAGLTALLAYWAEAMDENKVGLDFLDTQQFMKNLAKGAKALAAGSKDA
jgi:hypothetical protein